MFRVEFQLFYELFHSIKSCTSTSNVHIESLRLVNRYKRDERILPNSLSLLNALVISSTSHFNITLSTFRFLPLPDLLTIENIWYDSINLHAFKNSLWMSTSYFSLSHISLYMSRICKKNVENNYTFVRSVPVITAKTYSVYRQLSQRTDILFYH